MSLIDADKLIYEDVDCTDVNTYMVAHVPMIEARSTAYDIDKVVKQLEEIKAYMLYENMNAGVEWIDKAIEIVKAGGVDAKTNS